MSARSGRKRGRRAVNPDRGRAKKPALRTSETSRGRRSNAGPSRGYDLQAVDAKDSEYHYGSDFGDDTDDPSEPEERLESESESSPEPDPASDSDFSLSGRISPGEVRRVVIRPPSPEPLWIQRERSVPSLTIPDSSDDLPIPREYVLRACAVYEILRRFRHPVRLSPFRLEDLCGALACEEQSNLLTEVHIALLRALLREEDSQQTHFGPIDHKDSVNVTIYLLDAVTWPEVLRVYVESDKNFDRAVLDLLNSNEYPFASTDDRLKVLEFLCDQFLATNPVREDLTSEVSIHYDDHCRVCHRLGDLLCCETCPAVFHLECVDPPLVDVPSEDWQCNLCKLHRLPGVTDCVSDVEKQGLLCRYEHLGFDRHGRKYWFICRRIFTEGEDGTISYYSTVPQFEELLYRLDKDDMENILCRELFNYKTEICRQMGITEKITNQLKGNRKSYIEVENAALLKIQKERMDREFGTQRNGDINVTIDTLFENEEMERNEHSNISEDISKGESIINMDTSINTDNEKNPIKDDIKRRTEERNDKKLDDLDSQRLTRLKINQISSGTLLYKLGNDAGFKNYINQYTVNQLALNKPQRNEERDKKRHLAHKFSLTCSQEFKWIGLLNGTKTLLINTLRQTLLQIENNISSVFMHPNWNLLRKPWLQAVQASNIPRDFARAIIVLQACIKSVVFLPVWHEQLGHVRLQRTTAAEREERKKIEKREKKEKDEEEERNKITFFVKYPISFKHQIWKQKGEEYRIHGQWGWLWHSATRKFRRYPNYRPNLSAGPLKVFVQVEIDGKQKIIVVQQKTYEFLIGENKDSIAEKIPCNLKVCTAGNQHQFYEQIDVQKALTSSTRILYPKVARKCKIDDMLVRRLQLKVLEERKYDQNLFMPIKEDIKEEEDQSVDIENDENDPENSLISSNLNRVPTPNSNKDESNINKEIQILKQHYSEMVQLAKGYKCYNANCNANSTTIVLGNVAAGCYSPLCMRKNKCRMELLILLKKVQASTNNNLLGNATKDLKIISIHQSMIKSDISSDLRTDIFKELASAIASAQTYDEKLLNGTVKFSEKIKVELDTESGCEIKTECKDEKENICENLTSDKTDQILEESHVPAVGNEMELDQYISSENEIDLVGLSASEKPSEIPETERRSKRERKIRDISIIKDNDETVDVERPPIPKLRISTRGRSKSHAVVSSEPEIKVVSDKPTYRAPFNRRFFLGKNYVKKEEKYIKKELAPDGSVRVFSTVSTMGKVYLKKIVSVEKKKKRIPVKYPLCSTFHTRCKAKSIMILPTHELCKLARCGGRILVNGFNHNSKPNSCIWPYPCARPTFKVCWLYRTINLPSLASVALQMRILWTCLRWDDMATKPSNSDGKHQITTETEIITLEMLKHRNIGQFLDKTQYLRRKVIIPLEVPKTIREVSSFRSGLRKRKRAESPQSMEPQVTEEWVDEDKLELWEIKQYGERVERAVPITRTTTGKLPITRSQDVNNTTLTPKVSAQEIKEKMEQQLRLQRAAHQQKRAQEMSQAAEQEGSIKLISKNGTPLSGKSALTSLLTSNSGTPNATGNKTVIGTRRIFMTKGADGTTRVVAQPGVLQKSSTTQTPINQQAAIKSQNNQTPKEGPQKVQIIRGPDGKISVRGLIAGQQLIQMPDGKLHVIAGGQSGNVPAGAQIIATGGIVPTPKIAVSAAIKPHTKAITTPVKPVTATTTTTTPTTKVIIRQTPIKPLTTVAGDGQVTPATKVINQSPQIIVQGNQQVLLQPGVIPSGQIKISQSAIVQTSQTPTINVNSKPMPTVVVQGGSQIIQGQVIQNQVSQSTQVTQSPIAIRPLTSQISTSNTTSPQAINRVVTSGQQIVINNPVIAQQLTAGKLQLATINGQQVIIRPIGNGQALIVAHITPQPSQNAVQNETVIQNQVNNNATSNVVQQQNTNISNAQTLTQTSTQSVITSQNSQVSPVKSAVNTVQVQQQTSVAPQQTTPLTEEQLIEQRLLVGQPPGTVIKTVTAQVVQFQGSPRIVLQGLQGNTLTQQQLAIVQHQVKQQLLKAQEATGKEGVLGPTKLYLAVQPSPVTNTTVTQSSPSLTPIRTPQHNQISQDQQAKTITSLLQSNSNKKVITTTALLNGQDSSEPSSQTVPKSNQITSIVKENKPGSNEKSATQIQVTSSAGSNEFIITPDYIQQTIKNALKQDNLNPEIEEKLLQLQRYQERQMKPENNSPGTISPNAATRSTSISSSINASRRRPTSSSRYTDDEEWVESTPRKRNRPSTVQHERNDTIDESRHSRSRPPPRAASQIPYINTSPNIIVSNPTPVDDRKRISVSKLPILLFRHKENLKKIIIRKRSLLEKELGTEIQKELSAELALRTKTDRTKQEDVRNSNISTGGGNSSRRRAQQSNNNSRQNISSSSRSKKSSSKKKKLFCVCQTPYDDTKFYVGCEHCNNWFHGDCVGISEEMSKTIKEYVCDECKHARDTQELYCLCRQPYDNSQFYIYCDRCQDWFHGRCVGILQSEAENIDEYICPNCQKNNTMNYANMKPLASRDYDNLKRLIKQIQSHKSAWPFIEPVNPREVPMYYTVIKEPMDLQKIEKNINDQVYTSLTELIGDMTKIFDNCRYFNPKDSQFYRCAESLEAFFVQKVKFYREKLSENY